MADLRFVIWSRQDCPCTYVMFCTFTGPWPTHLTGRQANWSWPRIVTFATFQGRKGKPGTHITSPVSSTFQPIRKYDYRGKNLGKWFKAWDTIGCYVSGISWDMYKNGWGNKIYKRGGEMSAQRQSWDMHAPNLLRGELCPDTLISYIFWSCLLSALRFRLCSPRTFVAVTLNSTLLSFVYSLFKQAFKHRPRYFI